MTSGDSSFAKPEDRGRFPTALSSYGIADYGVGEEPRTLLELRLLALEGSIRDKQGWRQKIENEEIVERWHNEAKVDEDVWEYALAECKWAAGAFQEIPSGVEGAFHSDDLDQNLKVSLLDGISLLGRTDYHPGSNDQVIDLIHPSLYAYEHGKTPVSATPSKTPFSGFGPSRVETGKIPWAELASTEGLKWLPCDMKVEGEKCRIESYVNSLHPYKHSKLYRSLGKLFVHCLPLFESVLTNLGTDHRRPRASPLRIPSGKYREYREQGEDEDDYWENPMILIMPKLESKFTPPPLPTESVSLKNVPLQVIVKIGAIELTPDKPTFEGGTWHVEGMLDEHIVSTACVYLENDNVEIPSLEFRTAVREPDYEQGDDEGVSIVFGLENEQPLVQPRGVCSCFENRTLAWSNMLQHRLRPFSLVDKNKPGRRTFVCFFLCDPSLNVRSTATVPPQQFEWIKEYLENYLLPRETPEIVVNHIASYLPGPISYQQACERRIRLMDERKASFGENANYDRFFERYFSLCEH